MRGRHLTVIDGKEAMLSTTDTPRETQSQATMRKIDEEALDNVSGGWSCTGAALFGALFGPGGALTAWGVCEAYQEQPAY